MPAKRVRLTGVFRTVKVRAASTANVTIATALNSGDVIDGVTLADGDRVLLKNQTAGAENGVYVVGAVPARSADWATGAEVSGFAARVYEGTAGANTVWAVYAQPAVVGTNDPQLIRHERNGA